MRITGNGLNGVAPAAPASEAAPVDGARAAAPAAQAALQSSVLQPALAALRDMPEIDQARVAALKDALARGEVPFDPDKLAGLIERFHGSKG